jgi:hypothetical protein
MKNMALDKVFSEIMFNTCPEDTMEVDGTDYRLFRYNLHCVETLVLVRGGDYMNNVPYEIVDYMNINEGAMFGLKLVDNVVKIVAVLDDKGEQRYYEEVSV